MGIQYAPVRLQPNGNRQYVIIYRPVNGGALHLGNYASCFQFLSKWICDDCIERMNERRVDRGLPNHIPIGLQDLLCTGCGYEVDIFAITDVYSQKKRRYFDDVRQMITAYQTKQLVKRRAASSVKEL